MPMLQRPDGEIYYEEFGSGFPILLFAPGGLRSNLAMWHHRVDRNFARHCPVPTFLLPGTDIPHPAATSDELARLPPGVAVLQRWRGPEFMEQQRARVTAFLDRHTPAA
jgi:hypothetical protein